MPDIETSTDPFLEGLIEDEARARVTAHYLRLAADRIAKEADFVTAYSQKVAAAMVTLVTDLRTHAVETDRYADGKHAAAVARGKAQAGAE